jgi:hypothetical protein
MRFLSIMIRVVVLVIAVMMVDAVDASVIILSVPMKSVPTTDEGNRKYLTSVRRLRTCHSGDMAW